MPWFEYDGLTGGGTAIAGRIEAAHRDQAYMDLSQMQIEVRALRESKPPPIRRATLGHDDLMFFNEQLASLAQAGIALDEGLAQLAREVDSRRLRAWMDGLVQDLRRGLSIDQAVARREQGMPLLYSRVIRAGVESGNLPATLLNLNHHLRLEADTRRMIWEVASYPILVAGLALVVVSGFFIFVVPKFMEIFKDFGTSLPWVTIVLLKVGEQYVTILTGLAAVVAALAILWTLLRATPGGRAVRESLVLAIPAVGRVRRASLVARFLRNVSAAVGTGIPLPQAMRLSADATGSGLLGRDAEYLAAEVERGGSILAASQSTRIVPPLFGFCVQVAAGREALPVAIGQLAQAYENRALHAQAMLRVMLFPLLVLFLGGFLAVAITGMFLPLVTLINAVSGGG